jgi:hypothetical protein
LFGGLKLEYNIFKKWYNRKIKYKNTLFLIWLFYLNFKKEKKKEQRSNRIELWFDLILVLDFWDIISREPSLLS